jgi:hypothetical protein
MTGSNPKCPSCESDLEDGYLYARGLGAALFWSHHGDTGIWSRKNLQQIDLDKISITGTGGQAVSSKALHCRRTAPRRMPRERVLGYHRHPGG